MGSRYAVVSCILFMVFGAAIAAVPTGLKVGFYGYSCPSAEMIVRRVVNKYLRRQPGLGAGLVRMHFHDCFIRGCDASVMLKASTKNPSPERDHPANNPSLRGWEVIDEAKAILEAKCPRKVSCADILAFAARDSSYQLGRIWYDVPSGRRDGNVSIGSEVLLNLPPFFFTADQLISNFAVKGFTVDEMVTLSGSHSLGRAHCTSFSSRLYNFNNTGLPDPALNPVYAAILRRTCPPPPPANGFDPVVPLERISPNRLDNAYYTELTRKRGLLTSDQTLYDSPLTSHLVVNNVVHGEKWGRKFAKAMVKMGKLEPLTGKMGNIRKKCQLLN